MAPQSNTGAGAEAELPDYAGHYRLESILGSGGMGVVHLARSTSGMKLAVKVVHAAFARDPEFRGRFRQEVAAARQVSGAFTASVVDADSEAERPWMATLFIPGPTLSDHVKRKGAMSAAELRRLMAGLAEALRDIHRVGVVHRDLKPSNVLLAEDGPKVIDFGISRPKDSELRTETGKLIGTPPFMAPEQFRRPREVGPAADVFALGSVMVHAATGRGPFDSDSPYVVAYQVVHDEPDLTGVPASLAPLVVRCLAKEPEDRPTPDELMRELRSVAASYDTQAFIPAQRTVDTPQPGPEPRVEEGQRQPRRRRGKWPLVGAGLLGVATAVALGSVYVLGGDSPSPVSSQAPRTTSAAFSPWETASAPEKGTPQCSYGKETLVCAQKGRVFALDPSDGRQLWRQTVAAAQGGRPVVSGGLVQPALDRRTHLQALDPGSGRTRWRQIVPSYNGLAYAGATLLVTGVDGTVTGVDSASGRTKWSHRIQGHQSPYFASFAGDPLAYVTSPSEDGASTRVTAVAPQTGKVRWDVRLKGSLQPVGTVDGSVFFVSVDAVYGSAKAVVRYTPDDGASRHVSLPVALEQPQATVRGNRVYLMGDGGSLVAVDMDTRKQAWSLETAVTRGSAPVTDGRYVYFSAPDGRLVGVDAREGRLLGQTRPRLGTNSDRIADAVPAPVLADARLYAAAPDGTVFSVPAGNPAAW
ncbi:serine/threonine protein kinase [Streptomyces luteogriseus]|uniref:serine/threonine-protein kinase n=1 Tax=Streptomyces luteogriseus TaxID=68233 RepID=UPI002785791E|nr:serine/threonine-protein kinase [Streptomyces luteogriseus]MDQ0715264.1 serine/threonine protein kinase [Streptomyces luteogriseus]